MLGDAPSWSRQYVSNVRFSQLEYISWHSHDIFWTRITTREITVHPIEMLGHKTVPVTSRNVRFSVKVDFVTQSQHILNQSRRGRSLFIQSRCLDIEPSWSRSHHVRPIRLTTYQSSNDHDKGSGAWRQRCHTLHNSKGDFVIAVAGCDLVCSSFPTGLCVALPGNNAPDIPFKL